MIRDAIDTPNGTVVTPTEEVKTVTPSATNISVENQTMMEELAIAQVLNLDLKEATGKYKDQIHNILAWAKDEGFEDLTDLKWKIQTLQSRLGSPPLTEKWVTSIARFVYLDHESKRIKQEQQMLLR